MDTSGIGIDKQWYTITLNDSVKLPGTMDENKKGIVNTNTNETMRLSREFMYSGMAWYQKEINIPEKWDSKNIRLIMERTKPTKVWVDSTPAGENSDILTQQVYELSGFLTPGKHTITILVNNGNGSIPRGITGSHSWTEHTQTNWNGIIGKFCLEAYNKSYIKDIKTFPDIDSKKVLIKLNVYSGSETEDDRSCKLIFLIKNQQATSNPEPATVNYAFRNSFGTFCSRAISMILFLTSNPELQFTLHDSHFSQGLPERSTVAMLWYA